MALEPNDIDITGLNARPYGLLLDAARDLPGVSGIPRWALSGVKWVPRGCDNITVTTDGCDVEQDKQLNNFEDQIEQSPFLMLDAIACSTLGSDVDVMDNLITERLTVFASAAFASELMAGTNSTISFASANKLAGGAARSLRLAFVDLETWLAAQLHGAQGIIHLTPAAMALAAADRLVQFIDGRWVTATGHLVVADAGYTGPAPTGGTVSADQDWLYASGAIYYAITPVKSVGERNFQSTNIARNIHEFFSERYGIVVFDPCAVGAVRATLA